MNFVVFGCGAVQHADKVADAAQHADAFFVIRAISTVPQYKYHTVILLNCDVCPHFLRGKSRAGFFFDVIIVTS